MFQKLFCAIFVENLVYSGKYFVHYFLEIFCTFQKPFDVIQEIFCTFQKAFDVIQETFGTFFEERFLAFFRERSCALQKRFYTFQETFCVFRGMYFAPFGHGTLLYF